VIVIPSPNYHPGRLRAVRVAILHTAQTPCAVGRARGIAGYLSAAGRGASTHYAVDPGETVGQVDEQDTAWATPSANADGVQVEQAGYAEFGSGAFIPVDNVAARQAYGTVWPGWDHPEMRRMIVEQTVPLLVAICRRHNLPAVLLEPADLQDPGRRGITDHVRCSHAFGGDHWDCGGHYPMAEVVELVAAQLSGRPSPPVESTEDAMIRLIQDPATRTLWTWDGQCRTALTIAAGRDWGSDVEPSLKRLIAQHPSMSVWPSDTPGGPSALFKQLSQADIDLIPVR
jgi:hypothetical protein